MTILQQKADQRAAATKARAESHSAAAEAAAQRHLRAALEGAGALAGYLPIRSEIDPTPVMAQHRAPVGVPVILGAGQALAFHLWQPDMALIKGPFGAQIPRDGQPMVPQVLIVPLLAFDAEGYRLGYGGGFYDRTLAALRAMGAVRAIGFAFAGQEVDAVVRDRFDARLDAVVTETGLRVFT
jgi:5-formyltetrahydrofolate cyclo-ligase